MPGWALWVLLAVLAWCVVAVLGGFAVARVLGAMGTPSPTGQVGAPAAESSPALPLWFLEPAAGMPAIDRAIEREHRRVLVVDDDAPLRLLLRTTLSGDEFEVEEAVSAEEAHGIVRFWRPTVVILDIGLPGMDGLTFSRELKRLADAPLVVLLTGEDTTTKDVEDARADAVLRKPFSPLELLMALDRVSGPAPYLAEPAEQDVEQLLIYARDLRHLHEVERAQRRLLQQGYRQTATALADALEAKDPVTGLHALRVQRYALELATAVDRRLLDDPSLEYGFLLHDVGKIGIPDAILRKEGPLTDGERREMQRHTVLGFAILSRVAPLRGEGLRVVRSHHERWDGTGYPDCLAGNHIPVGARIFALVDALDAMTSERPYRRAMTWEEAVDEILAQNGSQFDPRVVVAFTLREGRMRRISEELAERAA